MLKSIGKDFSVPMLPTVSQMTSPFQLEILITRNVQEALGQELFPSLLKHAWRLFPLSLMVKILKMSFIIVISLQNDGKQEVNNGKVTITSPATGKNIVKSSPASICRLGKQTNLLFTAFWLVERSTIISLIPFYSILIIPDWVITSLLNFFFLFTSDI